MNRAFTPKNAHTFSITLTDEQMADAYAFAEQQEQANKKNKRRNVQGLRVPYAKSLEQRASSCYGDAALAIALGLPAKRVADHWRHRADVGGYDCMTTKYHDGCLIFTPRDKLLMRKVLVVDCAPVMWVCGWFECEEARAQKTPDDKNPPGYRNPLWRVERSGGGAWYVPQHMLRKIEEVQR